jgi:hypothetical protein
VKFVGLILREKAVSYIASHLRGDLELSELSLLALRITKASTDDQSLSSVTRASPLFT